jgi:hypothetical protein
VVLSPAPFPVFLVCKIAFPCCDNCSKASHKQTAMTQQVLHQLAIVTKPRKDFWLAEPPLRARLRYRHVCHLHKALQLHPCIHALRRSILPNCDTLSSVYACAFRKIVSNCAWVDYYPSPFRHHSLGRHRPVSCSYCVDWNEVVNITVMVTINLAFLRNLILRAWGFTHDSPTTDKSVAFPDQRETAFWSLLPQLLHF